METPRVRLGELLVESRLLSAEQLEEVLALQKKDGRRLGTLLVECGLVTETQVTQILSQQLSVPWVSLHHIDFSTDLLNLVPRSVVERYCLIPIYVRRVRGLGDTIYVAMDDPTNLHALREVAQHSGLHVRAMIASPSDIRGAIRSFYGVEEEFDDKQDTGVHDRSRLLTEQLPAGANAASSEDISARRAREAAGASSAGTAAPSPPLPPPLPPPVPAPAAPSPPEPAAPPPAAAKAPPSSSGGEPRSRSQRGGEAPRSSPSKGGTGRFVSLTLLDGTTIKLPARERPDANASAAPEQDLPLTARDLVAALRAASHGADVSEVLGPNVRWEAIVAALLAVLLKKHLITDEELIAEYEKSGR